MIARTRSERLQRLDQAFGRFLAEMHPGRVIVSPDGQENGVGVGDAICNGRYIVDVHVLVGSVSGEKVKKLLSRTDEEIDLSGVYMFDCCEDA